MPEHLNPTRSHGLVEILDRVLDKGLVIAGDIKINLANVELLTIQVRLLVCSIDKAEQIGLNWWRHDPRLTAAVSPYATGTGTIEDRLERIERRLEALQPPVRRPRGATEPSPTE
ncbi:MAG TPA: gas vesicle protein [Gemmatimonadaceae bacterium]|nr:gas vesicle protein [Gemmatimonadaceae bacterium]